MGDQKVESFGKQNVAPIIQQVTSNTEHRATEGTMFQVSVVRAREMRGELLIVWEILGVPAA